MYVAPETTEILFITERSLDAAQARDTLGLSVGVAPLLADLDEIHTQIATDQPKCVVISAALGTDQAIEIIEGIAGQGQSQPVVVFVGDRDGDEVERLLAAGAADVIKSTVSETSGALLRRRLDRVVPNGGLTDSPDTIQDRYETLLDTAADAIIQIDTDGYIIEANQAAISLSGRTDDEVIGHPLSTLLDTDSIQLGQALRAAQQSGAADDVETIEVTIERPDGTAIPCETRVKAIRNDGSLEGWVAVARDLREKQEREAELDRTRELLSNAERLGDVGVWEVNLETDEVFWSDGARRIRNIDWDIDPTPGDVLSFYHPDDRERVSTLITECQEAGDPFSTQARIITASDELRWVHLQGEPIETSGRRNVRGYIQDVTAQVEREQALQAERDLVEQIFDITPVGMVTIDPSGKIVAVNETAATILGQPEEAIVGSEYMLDQIDLYTIEGEAFDPEDYPATRILEDGEETRNEQMVIERQDGEERIISVDGVPLYDDGEIHRVILTYDDVTDSVEREIRLTEQRNELAQLDHINRIIRGVDQALLSATSRAEIMEAVCQRLSESNRYRFALALQSIGDGEFEPSVWDGPADEFVEEAFPIDDPCTSTCPGMRALEADESQVIQDIADPNKFDEAEWHEPALEAGVRSVVALPLSYEGQVFGIITVYAPFADAFSEREIAVLDELRETVGYAIAAADRRKREQILTRLYETTEDLLAATSKQEISDAAVDAASAVLDAPGLGICLFDDEENVLRTTAATEELIDYYGGVTEFGPGKEDSATWQTYLTGESQFFRDIRQSDHVVNPDTDGRSTLLLPLGEHGVFVVSTDQRGVFDEKKRQLIGLLAATTEAALDRVAGRADIREQERELAERTARVEELDSLLDLFQRVSEQISTAVTRSEVEQSVCEQLVTHDQFEFAWIGHVPPDVDRVDPEVWAGSADGYLDDIDLEFAGQEPAAGVAESGSTVTIDDVTDHLPASDWAAHAVNRDIQSVLAVPLTHGETTYGVLGVYAAQPELFDERARAGIEQIAEAAAYAIKSIETSQGVLAEQLTELELQVDNPDTFLNVVADIAGEPVTYREITPQPDGSTQVLFTLTESPVDEILGLESEYVSVDSLTAVERGSEHLFRATLTGQTVAATLLDCGSIPREVVARAHETTAVVRLSREIDVRVFIDRVAKQFPDTELLSRHNMDSTAPATTDMRAVIEDELTDRQREVLVTAYESGFFQSPRETTGEQLAELLDLSQPTVTHHLREAQRRLYKSLLDEW